MVPVNVEDLVWGVAVAQRLYSTGFRNVNNANQKYRDFGEDIRLLAINLDLISNIVQRAQDQAAVLKGNNPIYQPAPAEHQILGNFRETLNDCESLLDDQRYFAKRDGFVSNVSFYYQIDPEVQKLRGRIAVHNIKVNRSPSEEIKGEKEKINLLASYQFLSRSLTRRQIRGEECDDLPNMPPEPMAIPRELEDAFSSIAQELFQNLLAIPLDRGVDAAVFCFTRITKLSDQLDQSEFKYLTTIINTLEATWILRTIKSGQHYQNALQYYSPNPVEQQLSRWGMTIERFCNRFEENLHEAFRNLLGRYLLLPPTPNLLEIFEKERRMLQSAPVTTLEQETEPRELGTRIISAHLRSSDLNYTQTLEVYRQTEKRFSLVLVKASISEGRDKETTDGYDLEDVRITPSYAMRTWASLPAEPQTIRFRTDSRSPLYRSLTFYQLKDMFEFQQAITGYKVVHDDARVLTTSQQSKLLGGRRRQDFCRLQIWTASPSKSDATTAGRTVYAASTSSASIRSSQTSLLNSPTQPRKSSVFSLSSVSGKTKTYATSISSSSSSSVTTDLQVPANFVVPASGAVYVPPVTPCIVLFAHRVPERGEEVSRSFLIIDVNPEVAAEEELSEHTHVPSYRCVLESKGSYLPARRSQETSNPDRWDLAVAGPHKRQAGTKVVKQLRHVIIQFDSQTNLSQFTTKFNQVRDLAKLRLARFLQATGQA
ncbi:hypothetical protein V8E54_007689 [Elaphomyces granulatus]